MSFPGIPIPEEVVRDIAQSVIDKLDASDLGFVEYAIGQLDAAERDSLRTAFRKRPGKARLGYGHETHEDWQITVCLAATADMARSIGDAVGPIEEARYYTATLTADVSAARNVILPIAALPSEIPGSSPPISFPSGGRLRMQDEVAVWVEDPGGVRLSYRGVQGTVAVAHPAGGLVEFHQLAERLGWGEMVTVRCDILSSNPFFNLVLSTCVKAALLANVPAFETAGCTLHGISESDLTPRPETWPAHVIHRTLAVQVQRDFTVPDELSVLLDTSTDVQAIVPEERINA